MSVAIARAGHLKILRGADYRVVILLCATGSEEEALDFKTLFDNEVDARRRGREAVLVGRITEATLRHLGRLVRHVVALPATAESQPGGSLWQYWKNEHGGAVPWDTLRLDWTYKAADAEWIATTKRKLKATGIALKIEEQ